jgi:dihydropteroate synthase
MHLRFAADPRIMGILNTTDDSFYAGSRAMDQEAIARGTAMVDAGADWVDVGGESTRPGAAPVSVETEMSRVLPVIQGLRDARPDALISIDTRHADVAEAALNAGADMVNDVSGLRDPAMMELVLRTGCAVCIMHMQGEPQTMQMKPNYANVVGEVAADLAETKRTLVDRGHPAELIVIDPGIGFGKTQQHNLELLGAGRRVSLSDGPLLWGVSRKSVVGHLTGRDDPADRLPGTLGLATVAHRMKIDLLRVHDVQAHVDLFNAMRLPSTQPENIE